MEENVDFDKLTDPFSLAPATKLPEITDKLLEAGMCRPGDIFLPEEIRQILKEEVK